MRWAGSGTNIGREDVATYNQARPVRRRFRVNANLDGVQHRIVREASKTRQGIRAPTLPAGERPVSYYPV